MRKIIQTVTVSTAFLLMAGMAMAQPPDWYQHRDERYRGEHWRARMFTEIREDLNHVQASAFSGRDEYRIADIFLSPDRRRENLCAR